MNILIGLLMVAAAPGIALVARDWGRLGAKPVQKGGISHNPLPKTLPPPPPAPPRQPRMVDGRELKKTRRMEMNPGTGHLVKSLEFAPEEQQKDYEPIPKELERAAVRKLAGKSEAMVSLTSGGKLSRWAADRRKVRNRMAKESRRKNRGR